MWKISFTVDGRGKEHHIIAEDKDDLQELLVILLGRVKCLEICKMDLDPEAERA